MLSELNEALLRLRNAIIEAEKRRAAAFLAGLATGAIAGGLEGFVPPDSSYDYVDGLTLSELDDWADGMEEAISEAEKAEGN